MDARTVTNGIGAICLQGGRELTPACDDMDRAVLERCSGRVVVLAGAARPGSDYAGASARTVAHYARLGATVEVIPDPRDDHRRRPRRARRRTGLVVLPGGSPGGLLDVLTARPPTADDRRTSGRALVDRHRDLRRVGRRDGALRAHSDPDRPADHRGARPRSRRGDPPLVARLGASMVAAGHTRCGDCRNAEVS